MIKKYENLYAGLNEKKLIGGINLELLRKQGEQALCLSQLSICTKTGTIVGFISADALKLAMGLGTA